MRYLPTNPKKTGGPDPSQRIKLLSKVGLLLSVMVTVIALVAIGTVVTSSNGSPSNGVSTLSSRLASATRVAHLSNGTGYWLVSSDGGVFSFGSAQFYGSLSGQHLSSPIIGIVPTADDLGYWLVAKDGAVYSFGDAPFHGSLGNLTLAAPVVGMSSSSGVAGATGLSGVMGPMGPMGPMGNTLLNGIGAPATSLGNNGDFYLDTKYSILYGPKANGIWPDPGTYLIGAQGATGATGLQGPPGGSGAQGPPGATGLQGPAGPSASLAYAEFFALMPSDNSATVAAGAPVQFPQAGPQSLSTITCTNSPCDTFQLANIGTYEVQFQVSVSEAGQLELIVNGSADANTVVGRATGTSQIIGESLITTTTANETLQIDNPSGESTALTITPSAGGIASVSATVIIKQIG